MPYDPLGEFDFAPRLVNADIKAVRAKLEEVVAVAYGNMDSANYHLWDLCQRDPEFRTSIMRVLFSTNVVRYLSVMAPRPLSRLDYFPEMKSSE